MRLILCSLLYTIIYSALIVLLIHLPDSLAKIYSYASHAFLCMYVSAWISGLGHGWFFFSRVNPEKKAVLITGCDTGFGNGLAKRLDKKGFKVFASCLDPDGDGALSLKETCSDLLQVIPLNVTDEFSVKRAVRLVEDNLRDLDLWAVVNNAGVARGHHLEITRMRDFEDCMQVNAFGVVRVTKAFLPLLRKSKGRVVNICSLAGRFSCHYLGAYTMSKFAAVAFTEVLTKEMKDVGVRVISIEPEFFRTPMCSVEISKNQIDSALSDIEDEIKDAYGNDYIEGAKRYFLKLTGSASPNIHHVLNAIDKAVSLQHPADIYRPCRNLIANIFFLCVERMPRMIFDTVSMTFVYMSGVPKAECGPSFLEKLLNV